MVSPSRSFLAAILLTAAAGFASARQAQQANAPPPPLAPDAAVPARELPQLPVVDVQPVADPAAPAVDPAFTIDPSVFSAAIGAEPKSAAQSVAKPTVESTESFGPAPASIPSGTVATSQLEGLIPDTAAVDTGDGARTTMLVREWMLAGVLIFALYGIITLMRRRQTERGPIVDFTPLSPKLKPASATRSYGPRPV